MRRVLRLSLVVLVSTIAAGCAGRLRPGAPSGAGELDAFVVAHPDDWQLFMGDVAARAISSRTRTVFVYTTAGDAGRPASYWGAREQGALASVAYGLGVPPPDAAEGAGRPEFPAECADSSLAGRTVRRCRVGPITSYFLRLPDGNLNGEGFAATGDRSLMKLEAGATTSLAPVDGKGAYAGFKEVVAVVSEALWFEASAAGAAGVRVRVHATDPDAAFNPRDHADHRATGRLAASLASTGGFALSQYAGYSTSEWPTNLTAGQFAQKAALFMAYDRARVLANPEWSAYAELPAAYSSWLSRTYVRPAGFTGRSR